MSRKATQAYDGIYEISMWWASINDWVLWKTCRTSVEALRLYHAAFDEWEWVPLQVYDRLHKKVIAERPMDNLHPIKVDEYKRAWICVQNMIDNIEKDDVEKVEYAARHNNHIIQVKIHKNAYTGDDDDGKRQE